MNSNNGEYTKKKKKIWFLVNICGELMMCEYDQEWV